MCYSTVLRPSYQENTSNAEDFLIERENGTNAIHETKADIWNIQSLGEYKPIRCPHAIGLSEPQPDV